MAHHLTRFRPSGGAASSFPTPGGMNVGTALRGTSDIAASAACLPTPGSRWLYVSDVSEIDVWPSILLTAAMSTPAASREELELEEDHRDRALRHGEEQGLRARHPVGAGLH